MNPVPGAVSGDYLKNRMELNESKINQRVRRINKQLSQKYPLFFDQFKTDFETEKQNVIDKKQAFQEFLKYMEKCENERLLNIAKYVKICRREGLHEAVLKTFAFVMNMQLGTEYIMDGLTRALAEKWNLIPYQVHLKLD